MLVAQLNARNKQLEGPEAVSDIVPSIFDLTGASCVLFRSHRETRPPPVSSPLPWLSSLLL